MELTDVQREQVRGRIASFERLQRRNTDLVGWISLGMGVSRVRAARMLSAAETDEDRHARESIRDNRP